MQDLYGEELQVQGHDSSLLVPPPPALGSYKLHTCCARCLNMSLLLAFTNMLGSHVTACGINCFHVMAFV